MKDPAAIGLKMRRLASHPPHVLVYFLPGGELGSGVVKAIVLGVVSFMACARTPLIAAPAPYTRPVGLQQLQHTVVQPGNAPVGAVLSLAQDSDGFLWMTTFKGELLRFDGQTLTEPFAAQLKPFERPITILLGPHGESSDIWLGHRRHGLTHIVNGVASHVDGGVIPAGSVHVLRRDRNGVIWAVSPQGVAQYAAGHWRALPASLGWTNPHPEALTVDSTNGDVFVTDSERGALVSRRGLGRFEPVSASEIPRAEAGMTPGQPWPLPVEIESPERETRDGALWMAPVTGIERYRWSGPGRQGAPDLKERMTYTDGLSSTQVYDILEDHEGDVWLATTRGLDRFRRPHATPVVFPEPAEFPAIAATSDGSVWITSTTQVPWRYEDGKIFRIDALGDSVSAVESLRDGSVLFAGKRGLQRWKEGVVSTVSLPRPIDAAGVRIRQILRANDDSLWVVVPTSGLYHVVGDRWTRMNGRDGLPEATPSFVRRLSGGLVGVAYADEGFFAVGSDVRRLLPPQPAAGAPLDWLSEPSGMWIGGSKRLLHVDGHGARLVVRPDGRPYVAVSGMVRDGEGGLWVFHQDGIDRLAGPGVGARGGRSIHIDPSEGIGENPAGVVPVSSLASDAHGRIWVASNTVVAYFDPEDVPMNSVRPKVFVDALVGDQKPIPLVDGATVPALTHTLRIDYASPMLRRPEKARFEYKLSGVDDDWQQADNRRSAYYTNLMPGAYEFRVRAFNEDGVASVDDAVVHFRVAPMWYQTKLFLAALLVAIALLAWAAYVVRIRVITRRLRIRADERERIARDLHDTLLQGFQGLVLRFQAVRPHADSERARDMIDRALARADDVLVEGRDKVAALRRSDADNGVPVDFGHALEAIGEERSDLHASSYRVVVDGHLRALKSDVFENLLAISREAVLNAFQHADGSAVKAEVTFSRRMVRVRITDSGPGFVPRDREGHWGLQGMRERSAVIGAQLVIRSSPGAGTEVTVSLRSGRAYL